MAVFDTPITTDDRNLSKVLAQNMPVALFLYDRKPDGALDEALNQEASRHAGELLITRVDVSTSPDARQQYGNLRLPALVTLVQGANGRQIKSQAESVRPSDVHAHVDYLLGKGPTPAQPKPQPERPAASKGGASHTTDATFQKDVLESKLPVFVDFWAPWCGPCLSVAPLIEQLAGQYAGRVKIVKLNVDENPATQRRFQIQAIPTFITFRDGKPVERRSGASPQIIKSMIEGAQR